MSTREAGIQRIASGWRVRAAAMLLPALLVLLALGAVLPAAPVFDRTPAADSGSFLSVGQALLQGRVLYRDIWAAWPPLGYLITALGLALAGPGRWGLWALQFSTVALSGLLFFSFLERYFGRLPAGLAVAALLANLVFLSEGGAQPEIFALPLQAGLLLLLTGTFTQPHPGWRALGMGVLLGLAGSLRLTLLGSGLVISLCWLFSARSISWKLRQLAGLIAGILLVFGFWGIIFASQQALPALWDQTVSYTLFRSGVTNPERLQALRQMLFSLYWDSGFFALGLLAWLALLPFLFFNVARFRQGITSRWMGFGLLLAGGLLLFNGLFDDRARQFFSFSALSQYRLTILAAGLLVGLLSGPFLAGWASRWGEALMRRFSTGQFPGLALPLGLALMDLPAQILLSSLSGRAQPHEYLLLLPSLSILIAFLAWALLLQNRQPINAQNALIWLGILSLPVFFTGAAASLAALHSVDSTQLRSAVRLIRENASAGEPILQWGQNDNLYFLAERPAASRYLAQQALFTPAYASDSVIRLFLEDLQANPPAVVIDTRQANMPLVLPAAQDCSQLASDAFVEQSLRADWDARFPLAREDPLPYPPPEMKAVYRWLCEHYEPLVTTSPNLDGWQLYRLRAKQP